MKDLYMVRKKLMICSLVALGVILSEEGERGPMARLNPPQRRDSFPVSISAHFSIVAPLRRGMGGWSRLSKYKKFINMNALSFSLPYKLIKHEQI